MARVDNKAVLVTGASRGIGAATARALAGADAQTEALGPNHQRRAALFRPSTFFQNGRRPDEAEGPWSALLDQLYRAP